MLDAERERKIIVRALERYAYDVESIVEALGLVALLTGSGRVQLELAQMHVEEIQEALSHFRDVPDAEVVE